MSVYQVIAEVEKRGEAVALCTITFAQGSTPRRAGSKMLVFADGTISGTIGGGELENRVVQEALAAMADGKPRHLEYRMSDPSRGDPGVCGGRLNVYVEPVLPPATVVVVGAGHVGQAVAHLAKWLGFRVVVSDDREEFCNPEVVPDADAYYPLPLEQLPQKMKITPQTYFVLTTRNVMVDVVGLPAILDSPAAYVGVIGSRRRWATTRKKLLEAGVEEGKLSRVSSPIGLEIQAETPEEIALSIMAEVVLLRRGGSR
jgi:xanthine dehydrogenase accessory factor